MATPGIWKCPTHGTHSNSGTAISCRWCEWDGPAGAFEKSFVDDKRQRQLAKDRDMDFDYRRR